MGSLALETSKASANYTINCPKLNRYKANNSRYLSFTKSPTSSMTKAIRKKEAVLKTMSLHKYLVAPNTLLPLVQANSILGDSILKDSLVWVTSKIGVDLH